MKQSKLRRRRVIRYSCIYASLLILFIGILVAPIVAGKNISSSFVNSVPHTGIFAGLVQPLNQTNNDTGPSYVSSPTTLGQQTAAPTSATSGKVKLF